MKLSDFHYELPPEQIAQEPVSPRDAARLMVIDALSGALRHQHFFELDQLLKADDVLVVNATRVFPARLRGRKKSGGKVEVLFLNPTDDPACWEVLVRGSVKLGVLEFADGWEARMETSPKAGQWRLRFSRPEVRAFLETHGEMPLPPYIKRPSRRPADHERYQTVFAAEEGAVAAPTAGFHFTPELLDRLRQKGVTIVEIVLHVGWGTFRPVRTENVESHPMLPERYSVPDETATLLNEARRAKRRVIAVGTTAVRTLETIYDEKTGYHAGDGETPLFIYPGYRFRALDALITNFHLPDSTPLLLACAFKGNFGISVSPFTLRDAYAAAIREGYRFYSYGDAMLIQ